MHYTQCGMNTVLSFSFVNFQLPYNIKVLTIAHFEAKLNIPVLLDNGYAFSIGLEQFYDMI